MKVTAHIREAKTGRVAVYHDEYFWEDPHVSYFQWTDGNYGCDCNRGDFFRVALGLPEEEDSPCGTTRYVLEHLFTEDGTDLLETKP